MSRGASPRLANRWALLAAAAFLAPRAGAEAGPGQKHHDGGGAHVRLRWEAPRGCPQRRWLMRATESWLHRKVFVAAGEAEGTPDYVVQGHVEPREEPSGGRAWLARLRLLDREGRSLGVREVVGRGPRCGGLHRALPLVLALLVDLEAPRLRLHVPPAPSRAEPTPGPPASGSPRPAPSDGERGAELFVAPFVEGSVGQVPGSLGWGAGLWGGLRWPSGWRVGGGTWWMPGGTEPAFGGRAGLSYLALVLSGCAALPGTPAWAPGPCLALFVGRSERWGEGYVHDRREARPHLALEGSWSLRWELCGWAALGLRLGLRWLPARPELLVHVGGQPRRAFAANAWAPVLRLALELGRPPRAPR